MRIILPALIAAATIIGCAESASGPDSKIPAADANALRSLGFALADVQDGGDVYVLEGDMAIPKLGLREYQPIDAAKAVYLGDATPEASRGLRAPALGGAPRRQAYTNLRVSPSRIRNIKVDLSGLNSYPVWKTAAQQALAH